MSVDFILIRAESDARRHDDLLKADDLARSTGLRIEMIRRLYRLGLFDAEEMDDGEPLFSPGTLYRVQRTVRLRRDLGISWHSMGLVADLLERVEALEAHIRSLETERDCVNVVDDDA